MPTLDLAPYVANLRASVGRTYGPVSVEVEKGAIAKFARSFGETNPLYFDEAYARTTRFGGIIAPPTYVSALGTELFHGAMSGHPDLKKKLHASDIVANHEPIRAGDVITVTITFADAYAKEGRSGSMLFEVFDTRLVNQHGREVAVVRMLSTSL